MITIAVTGGIGAGKSETVNVLERLGASILNADLLGHAAYAKHSEGYAEVVEAFGDRVVSAEGEIDRKMLGDIVFANPEQLRKLESIVWRHIREMIETSLKLNAQRNVDCTVVEAAVLFEAGWEDLADTVWTVEASYHQRLARIENRPGMTRQLAKQRIDAQNPPEFRIERADTVIRNDGELSDLERKVNELWKAMMTK